MSCDLFIGLLSGLVTGLALGAVGTFNFFIDVFKHLNVPRPVVHRPTATYTVPPPTSTMGSTTVNYPVSFDFPVLTSVGSIIFTVVVSLVVLYAFPRLLTRLGSFIINKLVARQATTGSVSATDPATAQFFLDTDLALGEGAVEIVHSGKHACQPEPFPLVEGALGTGDQGGLGIVSPSPSPDDASGNGEGEAGQPEPTPSVEGALGTGDQGGLGIVSPSPLPEDAAGTGDGDAGDACPRIVYNGKPKNRRAAQKRANQKWAARKAREEAERKKKEEEEEGGKKAEGEEVKEVEVKEDEEET
ncbi:MAG: hypothetical protein LQ352_003251, partial [Teloschistes flavicans]